MPDPPETDRSAIPVSARQTSWPRLTRVERLALGLTVVVVVAVTLPRLPPGVCFGDGGDLQLASATLGIMHPPGYAGYVTLGYLVTRMPGADPAYMVSLACLASGLAALMLCMLMQIRLGVNSWIAGALTLALAGHPRIWSNLIAPEVYAPSLAFLVSAAYCLMRYARLGVRRDLFLAATLLGFALANRPPVLFTLPFFVIAWWLARSRWETSVRPGLPGWRRSAASLSLAATCAALPCFYTFGYLWVRDRPDISYNYIEQYNAETSELPPVEDGWPAKLQRVVWQACGMQFANSMGNTWAGVQKKLRWLRYELLHHQHVGTLAIMCAVIALSAAVAYRRCRSSAWLLSGMMIGSVVFVCAYRMHGQAADLLPLLFATTVLFGVGVSPLFPRQTGRRRQWIAIGVATITCVAVVLDTPDRRATGAAADATLYLAELDMKTLPADAVICSMWHQSPPLWYAKHVLTRRHDIEIINALPDRWLKRIARLPGRPVFVVTKSPLPKGCILKPYRNLWRLERLTQDTSLTTK